MDKNDTREPSARINSYCICSNFKKTHPYLYFEAKMCGVEVLFGVESELEEFDEIRDSRYGRGIQGYCIPHYKRDFPIGNVVKPFSTIS